MRKSMMRSAALAAVLSVAAMGAHSVNAQVDPGADPNEGGVTETADLPEAPEVPDAEVPDPDAEVPDAEVPDAEVPDAEVPEGEVPETEVPEGEVPDAEVPEAEVPDAEEAEVPEAAEAEVPDAEEAEVVDANESEGPDFVMAPEPEIDDPGDGEEVGVSSVNQADEDDDDEDDEEDSGGGGASAAGGASGSDQLPSTGTDATSIALLGALAIAAGGILHRGSRRARLLEDATSNTH